MADREFLSRLGEAFAQAQQQQQQQQSMSPDEFRRALMLKQMRDAQGISDAVRGPQQFQWAPPANQLLPEWPVQAPWPGSPRTHRVA